jgi:muconolactone delta-isomerase
MPEYKVPEGMDPDTYAMMKAIEDEESQRLAEQL